MVSAAVRRSRALQREIRRRRRQQQQEIVEEEVVEEELLPFSMDWPLYVKIGNFRFRSLDAQYIKNVLESIHPGVSILTTSQMKELIRLIQEDRIGNAIYEVSCARTDGENVTEDNLLSIIARDFRNYVDMGAEFFYPMFRELLRIDPGAEKKIVFNRYFEIKNHLHSCGIE